jgi:hypothetical protein
MVIESELPNVTITLAQTAALVRVFNRNPLYFRPDEDGKKGMPASTPLFEGQPQLTFDEYMEYSSIDGYGCIMIPWNGMWLGIEKDGYTHS